MKNVVRSKFTKLLIVSLVFIIIAEVTTALSSYYIYEKIGSPPVVWDFMWSKLPYYNIIWITEVLLVISFLYGAFVALRINKYYIPYAIIIISMFHIIRAGIIFLTPLGFPQDYSGFLNPSDKRFNIGAFPSGHLSVPYFIYMITKNKVFIVISILVAITLLISRAHYSIDLIGTLLLAYPIFKFSDKYLSKYFKNG